MKKSEAYGGRRVRYVTTKKVMRIGTTILWILLVIVKPYKKTKKPTHVILKIRKISKKISKLFSSSTTRFF